MKLHEHYPLVVRSRVQLSPTAGLFRQPECFLEDLAGSGHPFLFGGKGVAKGCGGSEHRGESQLGVHFELTHCRTRPLQIGTFLVRKLADMCFCVFGPGRRAVEIAQQLTAALFRAWLPMRAVGARKFCTLPRVGAPAMHSNPKPLNP